MAGKITELTDAGTLTGAELVEVVDDPAGTPVSRKTTVAALRGEPGDGIRVLPNTVDYFNLRVGGTAVALQDLKAAATPMSLLRDATLSSVAIEITTGVAASTIRLGVYGSTVEGRPGSLVADFGAVAADTAGKQTISSLAVALPRGLYWFVCTPAGGLPSIRGVSGGTAGGLSFSSRGSMGDNLARNGWYSFNPSSSGVLDASPTWASPSSYSSGVPANYELLFSA